MGEVIRMPTMRLWNEFIGKMNDVLDGADKLAASVNGDDSIDGTDTSVTITHEYGSAPEAYQIKIVPTNAYMAAKGWYITGITDTVFVVNIPTAPGGGNSATFEWEIY